MVEDLVAFHTIINIPKYLGNEMKSLWNKAFSSTDTAKIEPRNPMVYNEPLLQQGLFANKQSSKTPGQDVIEVQEVKSFLQTEYRMKKAVLKRDYHALEQNHSDNNTAAYNKVSRLA